jgi:hypothetical protein
MKPRKPAARLGSAFLLTSTFFLCACGPTAPASREQPLTVRRIGANEFEIIARATRETPEWSPKAEADRRTLVGWQVRDAKLCPNGEYAIVNRAVIPVYPPLEEADVRYIGRCK